jgi:hypothetical protein
MKTNPQIPFFFQFSSTKFSAHAREHKPGASYELGTIFCGVVLVGLSVSTFTWSVFRLGTITWILDLGVKRIFWRFAESILAKTFLFIT